jgi:nicotinamide-nucleotide amidase
MYNADMKIAVAESCTGGLLSHFFTKESGASRYFTLGITAYSNQAKIDILGISKNLIDTHDAVSAEVAEEMAKKVRILGKAEVGISTTGLAGPGGGRRGQPVGTVFIAVSLQNKLHHRKLKLHGSRDYIQTQVIKAVEALLKELNIKFV